MPVFGEGNLFPTRAATPDTVQRRAVIDIGATGAPTVRGDPGIGVTRSAVGIYDVTFPPIADYTKTLPVFDAGVNKSPATTIGAIAKVAFAPDLGTAQIRTFLAAPGTGVDPASGDQIWVLIIAGGSGVR